MKLLKVLYDQTLLWLYRWAAIKNNELRAVGSCVELQSGLEALGRMVFPPSAFLSSFSGIPLVITNIYFCTQEDDSRNDTFR